MLEIRICWFVAFTGNVANFKVVFFSALSSNVSLVGLKLFTPVDAQVKRLENKIE